MEYQEKGLPPEHPRASATDDVEGIIALMHEMLGDIFDVKQFLDAQPKILNEFKKRIDPELEFYYWTGAKERYRDFELPSFNQPSGDGLIERLDSDPIKERRSRYICRKPSFPATKGTAHCKGTISQSPSGTATTPDKRGSLTVL